MGCGLTTSSDELESRLVVPSTQSSCGLTTSSDELECLVCSAFLNKEIGAFYFKKKVVFRID